MREVVVEAFMGGPKGKHHHIKWDSTELPKWVTALSERVFALQVRRQKKGRKSRTHACTYLATYIHIQEKTDDLLDLMKQLEAVMKNFQVGR